MTATDWIIALAALFGMAMPFDWYARVSNGGKALDNSAWMLVLILIVTGWGMSHTWRGLMYTVLMPIGAFGFMYALFDPIATWFAAQRLERAAKGRDDQPRSS